MTDTRNRKNDNCMEVDFNENLEVKPKTEHDKLSIQDKKSICLLTFLYILQGIPLGLAGSVPYILQSRHVSYSTQATFSLVFWPFSLKIFWAPIVDTYYFRSIGRRKTWMIPAQFLIGISMLIVSMSVTEWIEDKAYIHIVPLTASFFFLNFLAATQDIAVDGWALTMLSRKSVGWASTCNSVGQTTGYFIAFIIFLSLESAEFCNAWLRSIPQQTGLISFSGFLYFWGIVFIISTTFVLIFKKEKSDYDLLNKDGDKNIVEKEMGLWETYQTLWKIINLKPIILFITALAVLKVGFSATDSLTGLKLMERGVSKEKLAFIGTLVVPLQISMAIFVSKYTTGSHPLSVFIAVTMPRLLFGIVFGVIVSLTPDFKLPDGTYSFNYYFMITIGYIFHQLLVYPMFVSQMAFYARISDPNIGGTYMTFLNTISNLSGNIPNTVMLYLVDHLTVKTCIGGVHNGSSCNKEADLKTCHASKPAGICTTTFDGYYLQISICTTIGLIAIFFWRKRFDYLQNLPIQCWHIKKKPNVM